MSLFPIPAIVIKKLNKLRRDFLWKGNKEDRGYNLVKWEVVQQSKGQGGLGIKNLRIQNNSLLLKWLWRFSVEESTLWKEVIAHKFGQSSPWCSNEVICTYGMGVWRTIRSLWPKLQGNSRIRVGEGTSTLFWKDIWIGQAPLQEVYPDLMMLSNNPEATVAESWSNQGWNLNFRRHLNDWEVDRVITFLSEVENFPGTNMQPDTLRWNLSGDGIFSVNKMYKRDNSVMQGACTSIWKSIWKSMAPTKIKCFTWLVVKRACLTHEVLQKKGRIVVTRCFLCNETGETNNHLFLHCKFTSQLWNLFLGLTKTEWTMPEHTADLMSCWMRRGGSKSQRKWWRIIPSCIWWAVWKERNGRCFDDKIKSIHHVKWSCLVFLFSWCKGNCIEEVDELVDFLGAL